jgi:hypothetical protein
MLLENLRAGDDVERTPPMKRQRYLISELEPAAETAAPSPDTFSNRVELSVLERKQGNDAVGLAEVTRAQDDAARFIGARQRRSDRA